MPKKSDQIELSDGDSEKTIATKLKQQFKKMGIPVNDSDIRKKARELFEQNFDKDGNVKKKR